MSAIDRVFAERVAAGQLAFIPFVTAGDPDLGVTTRVIEAYAAAGADLIEVGFPYSDPIADGPVIQASYTRALNKKIKLVDIFAAVGQLRGRIQTPLMAMVSYAIIFRHGPTLFLQHAAEAGFAGLIVPDLPGDEADEFAALTAKQGLALVQLVAPTTPADRLERILKHATGFVYCIAVAGVTGARNTMPVDLTGMLTRLRAATKLPLAVGFGLSQPEQIRSLKGQAQGAIVGSALVKQLDNPDVEALLTAIKTQATALAAACH